MSSKSPKSPASSPAPTFDPTTAKPITPRRHTDGRTISLEQTDSSGAVHGFSATGLFIATKPAKKSALAEAPVAPPSAQ